VVLLVLHASHLWSAGTPHHVGGIAIDTNGIRNLRLEGAVSNLFSLPASVLNQYLQMFDLILSVSERICGCLRLTPREP